MTKEEVLEVLNDKNKEVRYKLLKEYCLEKGKTEEQFNIWYRLSQYPISPFVEYYIACLQTAINYFKHKHSIHEVRKPHNEGYEVILYY